MYYYLVSASSIPKCCAEYMQPLKSETICNLTETQKSFIASNLHTLTGKEYLISVPDKQHSFDDQLLYEILCMHIHKKSYIA